MGDSNKIHAIVQKTKKTNKLNRIVVTEDES